MAKGEQKPIDESWPCFEQDEIDSLVGSWTRERDAFELERTLQRAGIPAGVVRRPQERIDQDPSTEAWGLWPMIDHPEMGGVRVDGQPAHFSGTDWSICSGGPTLGQHNAYVLGEVLGLSEAEIADLTDEGVI